MEWIQTHLRRRPGPAWLRTWWKTPTRQPQEGHWSMRNPTVIPHPAPGRSCEGGLPSQRRYKGMVDVHPGKQSNTKKTAKKTSRKMKWKAEANCRRGQKNQIVSRQSKARLCAQHAQHLPKALLIQPKLTHPYKSTIVRVHLSISGWCFPAVNQTRWHIVTCIIGRPPARSSHPLHLYIVCSAILT